MNRGGQRGFTLIELMVALLVSSLLVGMILAIFSRMSLAYRGQQQIAGVQQVLSAARAMIEIDAKQAGLGMPQGFKITGGGNARSPVQVINSAVNPDQVAFFYADTSVQAVLTGGAMPTLTVDQTTGFLAGMLVVLTSSSTVQAPVAGDPDVAAFDACVVQITAIAGNNVTFSTAPPWGAVGNPHCTNLSIRTMMYRFVAHAYRIDVTSPARAALGALQQSVTGGLLGVNEEWVDLAFGFGDIQTAVRLQEVAGADLDNDGNANRNWYSGANQDIATGLPTQPANATLLQMTISLLAHTDRNVEGVTTAATPSLIAPNPANPAPPAPQLAPITNNNALGDRPSTVLPVAQPWPDPLQPGQAIYRHITFQVDFRNLGIGQQ